ncbi:MAG: hypothetical protein KME10_12345 [Plectolyngbya sp. WJT66-NPBG17]|jgi:hypothetical protein|nr:hypothetical protein [Plectolyngbya sp. WJT66-NPBG17]
MDFFKSALQTISLRFSSIAVASCLAILTGAIAAISPASAEESSIATTSIQQAPYSQVFYTGSIYAVKDQDYKPSNPKLGFFSVWSKNPTRNDLRVSVHYCLKDQALSEPGNDLTQMTILNNRQPLLTINQVIAEKPVHEKVTRPGYYQQADVPEDSGWIDPVFWDLPYDSDFDSFSPVYIPPAFCNAGFTQFEISPLKSEIAQLPDQTLQVQLSFSNGEKQNWHLGKGTVQALKQLITIR